MRHRSEVGKAAAVCKNHFLQSLEIHHGSVAEARINLTASPKRLPFTATGHSAVCSQELSEALCGVV
ncbi:hypothetical protein V5799_013863 [Amblyomma americanum]|uniref:Uncharacterized protein n=1 Tax=Amblyomma americanum TaxID=6943 RepID=A0AAQ4E4V3_AMBAM